MRGRELAATALEAAAGDIEYRDGVFRIAGTDRRIGLFELAGRQPGQKIVLDSAAGGRAGPTAVTSAKSRSIRKPARSRWSGTGRSTMSAASSIR